MRPAGNHYLQTGERCSTTETRWAFERILTVRGLDHGSTPRTQAQGVKGLEVKSGPSFSDARKDYKSVTDESDGYTSHVGGSNYETQRHSPATLLRFCYLRSPDLAVKNRLGSIAFPGMGTGAYGSQATCLSTWLGRTVGGAPV